MLFEDRLEAAERRRAEGNALFKAGDGEMALRRYHLALSYLDADLLMQLESLERAVEGAAQDLERDHHV